MDDINWGLYIPLALIGIFVLISIFTSFYTVAQGDVAVITRWGKFRGIGLPGLNWKTPFIDAVHGHYSVQNQSEELKFQAITKDQANVFFTAMIIYAVRDSASETIQKVAFKFIDEKDFQTALQKSIEGSVRSFVASKGQGEVLALRSEIVQQVKSHLDETLLDWGYHLLDIQVNDISFDKAVTDSMAQIVASGNLKAAAENQGQALLIQKTKAAEAEGNAIRISAQAEKDAAKLRGEGVAAFRLAVSQGIEASVSKDVDIHAVLFSMWCEAVKNFAEGGKGNVIFLDGSADGMQRTLKQMQAYQMVNGQ